MQSDDASVSRRLSRRTFMTSFGATATEPTLRRGTAALVLDPGGPMPDCVAQPEQTEGPYFVDEQLRRSDIRTDPATGRTRPGRPLALEFVLSRVTSGGACAPLAGAQMDLWHCDAGGIYSGVRDRRSDTTGEQFLRGYQISDAEGVVRFTTIYPGWYPGRAVHIHFKIRVPASGSRRDEFTSQLYFTDALTDRVHAQPPYSRNRGQRLVNDRDMIYREGGAGLMLPVVEQGAGLAASYRIAMRPGQPRAFPSR